MDHRGDPSWTMARVAESSPSKRRPHNPDMFSPNKSAAAFALSALFHSNVERRPSLLDEPYEEPAYERRRSSEPYGWNYHPTYHPRSSSMGSYYGSHDSWGRPEWPVPPQVSSNPSVRRTSWDDRCRDGFRGEPTSTRSPYYPSRARLSSEVPGSSMVTPTPKKLKVDVDHPHTSAAEVDPNYCRKKKSLGRLADNFIDTYNQCAPGTEIIVDQAAADLAVERRRIYDIVNILESVCLLQKKHKNTYTWLGSEDLPKVFKRLQEKAIREFPEDALKNGIISELPPKDPSKTPRRMDDRSLTSLSQQFLHVFLVGNDVLCLPEASDKIQGKSTEADLAVMGTPDLENLPSTENELKAAAARGLKTKIRRLYDIANVFLSLGLFEKVNLSTAKGTRRPHFKWAYDLTPKEIHSMAAPKDASRAKKPPALRVSIKAVPYYQQDSQKENRVKACL